LIVWGHLWWVWVLAIIVGTVSVARMARLLVFDDFPPVEWLRLKFFTAFGDSPWRKLGECGFCLAPYLAAVMVAWALLSDLAWWWWLPNIWFGVISYGAAILVSYDQPVDGAD
jgi:hypothetical protein